MTTATIEKIQTGLTANYVNYFSTVQSLKEAMQNIAYGSIKSGKPAKLYFDTKENMWAIKDKYEGFEKKHLYIGESEQRNDEDGLGTFGEGWKIFLLDMARNDISHRVDTVGFSFWGTMEDTPHGTKVLVINIEDNTQQSGTKVYADVDEELWRRATKSFAVLQDIDPLYIKENTILPSRNNELWVNGVRIENEENTNPLNLYYSYNLAQRHLINRDRSHVNTELAYQEIKKIIFNQDYSEVKEYVSMALEGKDYEDILRGPYVPITSGEQGKVWLEVLAELHACKEDKLVIPSYNQAVNSEAKKRGYSLLDTPRKWDFEIQYLGIRKADDVIDDRYDVVEEGYSGGRTREEKSALAKAKAKFKKAFSLGSVSALPKIQYVEEIKNPVNGEKKVAHFELSVNVLYLAIEILENEKLIVENALPELMDWWFKDKGMTTEQKYKQVVINLMGL
jgi:hypothetical protein